MGLVDNGIFDCTDGNMTTLRAKVLWQLRHREKGSTVTISKGPRRIVWARIFWIYRRYLSFPRYKVIYTFNYFMFSNSNSTVERARFTLLMWPRGFMFRLKRSLLFCLFFVMIRTIAIRYLTCTKWSSFQGYRNEFLVRAMRQVAVVSQVYFLPTALSKNFDNARGKTHSGKAWRCVAVYMF